ncbi:Uncharacterised protein [Mycobacterium tuberculosis]|nr:Uncharacterised protein [Mycobacterium tuberculosis]
MDFLEIIQTVLFREFRQLLGDRLRQMFQHVGLCGRRGVAENHFPLLGPMQAEKVGRVIKGKELIAV